MHPENHTLVNSFDENRKHIVIFPNELLHLVLERNLAKHHITVQMHAAHLVFGKRNAMRKKHSSTKKLTVFAIIFDIV